MFPCEIWNIIYQFDGTYHVIFKQCLEDDLIILQSQDFYNKPFWFVHANGIHEKLNMGVWLMSVDKRIWENTNESFTCLTERFFQSRAEKNAFLETFNTRNITHSMMFSTFQQWHIRHLHHRLDF